MNDRAGRTDLKNPKIFGYFGWNETVTKTNLTKNVGGSIVPFHFIICASKFEHFHERLKLDAHSIDCLKSGFSIDFVREAQRATKKKSNIYFGCLTDSAHKAFHLWYTNVLGSTRKQKCREPCKRKNEGTKKFSVQKARQLRTSYHTVIKRMLYAILCTIGKLICLLNIYQITNS